MSWCAARSLAGLKSSDEKLSGETRTREQFVKESEEDAESQQLHFMHQPTERQLITLADSALRPRPAGRIYLFIAI